MLAPRRGAGSRLFLPLVLVSCLFSVAGAQNPAGVTSQPSTTGWKIKFDESGSRPVLADGVLYIGSADGAVYALDPTTGATKWRFQTGENLAPATSGPLVVTVPRGTSAIDQMVAGMKAAEKQKQQGMRKVDMTPVVDNGTVFVGSGDLSFYAIDAATGKKKWSYEADSEPQGLVTIKNGTVYFVTEDGLNALDAQTGKRNWLFQTWQPSYFDRKHAPNGPFIGDNVIFLTLGVYLDPSTVKSFLYAIDPESGKAKWVTSVGGLGITAAATAKGLAFFAVDEPGPTPTSFTGRVTLYAINAGDGQVRWKLGTGKKWELAAPLIVGDTIYFCTDTNLLALELETGRQLWSFSADEISQIHADDQRLYVTTHKGSIIRPKDTLHALALTTGQEKWSQGVGGIAMVQDGVVYAGRERLQAIDAATGKELWSFKGTGRESVRLISGDRIFLTSPAVVYSGTNRVDQGYLYAIDAKTGKLKP